MEEWAPKPDLFIINSMWLDLVDISSASQGRVERVDINTNYNIWKSYFFFLSQWLHESSYTSSNMITLLLQARPLFKDRKKFHQMADPALEGHYPVRGLYQALAIAAMCVQEQPNMRPPIVDIVTALSYLASLKYDPEIEPPIRKSYKSQSPQKSIKDDDETW